MNTGTPLDLTPFGFVLSGIGIVYWLIVLGAVGLVLWKVKGWPGKLILSAVVLAVLVGPVALRLMKERTTQQKAKTRLDAAIAQFETRCKTAGEKITHSIENVDGVVWMKWREKGMNRHDQFKLDDPFGKDCEAEGCIRLLLHPQGVSKLPEVARRYVGGYLFVETIDPRDGVRYRYTAVLKPLEGQREEFERSVEQTGFGADPEGVFVALERKQIDAFTARYGITWDDISTHEDREFWIAGGSLKVVDLKTNEPIAERIGYMMDRGQGSEAGFRSPWLSAEYAACPAFDKSESNSPTKTSRSRDFIRKVLKATQGE